MKRVRRRSRGARWQRQRGMTLIEVMVCVALLAIAVLGMGASIFEITNFDTYNQNRSVAHQAAQETMELLATESTASVLSRNGTTGNVLGMDGIDGTNALSITVTDLGWDGTATQNQTLLITVDVSVDENADGTKEMNYARLQSVRTGY